MARNSYSFLLLLALTAFFLSGACSRADKDQPTSPFSFLSPLSDVFGRPLGPTLEKATYLYIQFVRQHARSSKFAEEKFIKRQSALNDLVSICILDEGFKLNPPKEIPPNVFFLSDSAHLLSDRVKAPWCCEAFYIFGRRQGLLVNGNVELDNETDVGPYLREILNRANFKGFDSDYRAEKIREIGLLNTLREETLALRQERLFWSISLVAKVCNTCPIATALDKINGFYQTKPPNMSFLVIVPEEFSDEDIFNLRAALSVSIPIVRAAGYFGALWHQLRADLPNLFDNIGLITDSQGTLIELLDNIRPQPFLRRLEDLCRQ